MLLKGPPALRREPIYYYNLGCYEALLGYSNDARRHLETSFQMDGSFRELAKNDPDLKSMNRLESGVVRPKQEWCDLRELLESAIEIERESLSRRKVKLEVPDNVPLAFVDYTLLEQAVAKLVANAISHAPSRVPIEIDTKYQNDQLIISVSDRGPGLDAGSAERVFEKFYRGDGRKPGGDRKSVV